ncbi:MAG: uroporphyrinogen-III synthase [Alphaproteobacteria bacterium]|nr:uroporphyrinogen-III synthase [Alphaproteobacteria bacterium]
MRVLITRPQEDGATIAAQLAAAGHQPLLAPLLQTRWLGGPPLDLAGVAAILATSANGVRAFARRSDRRDIPLFAVGPQTTQEARAAGFAKVENAAGDARALAAAVPGWIAPAAGPLLHICGEDGAGNLAEELTEKGYAVRRQVLYAVDALPLPHAAAKALRAGAVDAALFFSPRSARIFLEQAAGMPLGSVTAFCISPATAAVLPAGTFAAIRVAAMPNQEALLALMDRP